MFTLWRALQQKFSIICETVDSNILLNSYGNGCVDEDIVTYFDTKQFMSQTKWHIVLLDTTLPWLIFSDAPITPNNVNSVADVNYW